MPSDPNKSIFSSHNLSALQSPQNVEFKKILILLFKLCVSILVEFSYADLNYENQSWSGLVVVEEIFTKDISLVL